MTTWQQIATWIAEHRVGDLASIGGVLISIVGFVITIFGVFRSKSAAQRAEAAAKATRESIKLVDTVVDFTAAISTLEEIKRMQRKREWPLLPDRYATIRKTLLSIRTFGHPLTNRQSAMIQGALTNLRSMETRVEKAILDGSSPDPMKFNKLISDDIDKLVVLLSELKASGSGG